MTWTLYIHTIDVGQGEATFVIAHDPTIANGTWTMLIDGGHAAYAPTVHAYISSLGAPVHTFVCSHYDTDHSGGLLALLIADDLYAVCDTIASVVATQLNTGVRATLVARFAAAGWAAVMGAYGPSSVVARVAATAAQNAGTTDDDPTAVAYGLQQAARVVGGALQPRLANTATRATKVANAVAIAAANAGLAGLDIRNAARSAALSALFNTVPKGSRFDTGGLYATTRVIDLGYTNAPWAWGPAIRGTYTASSNHHVAAPDIDRRRISLPSLGWEVLSAGLGLAPQTATSPAVYVVAVDGTGWPSGDPLPPSGQRQNDASIGLILRFNEFFYWTGGDLMSAGEDVVAGGVMASGLPDPAGGSFPPPDRIACFKCGHHGSDGATSQQFLNTVNPAGATISSGAAGFQHPSQVTIARLKAADSIDFYYLTNCLYPRVGVPGSQQPPLAQIDPPNTSRVAGDNSPDNLANARARGNIILALDEALAGLRAYAVSYWDRTIPQQRIEYTDFTDDG